MRKAFLDSVVVLAAASVVVSCSKPSGGGDPGGPPRVDAGLSTVEADRSSVPADGTTAANVTVTVRDTTGAVMSGQTVSLAYSGTASITPSPTTTDANGVAAFQATATAETSGMLTATVSPGGDQVMLTSSPALAFVRPPSVWYVAPTGSDSNPGTQQEPFLTLQRAADATGTGDTVLASAGNYAGFVVTTSGTAGYPITFRGESGAVIDGDAPSPTFTGTGIVLSQSSRVAIEGFTVVGRPHGIVVSGADPTCGDIEIRRNHVGGSTVDAILVEGNCPRILIEDNDVYASANAALVVSGASDGPIIRKNRITASERRDVFLGGDPQWGDGIISDALVEANVFLDSRGRSIHLDAVRNSVVRNNVVSLNTSGIRNGIYISRIATAVSSSNTIVNNTIVGGGTSSSCAVVSDSAASTTLLNNILRCPSTILVAGASVPQGLVSDYNIVGDAFATNDSTGVTLSGWRTATGQDMHSLAVDPLFVGETLGNYHLAAGSPAIDTGTSQSAPALDLDGIARPLGAAFDIGAYEYMP